VTAAAHLRLLVAGDSVAGLGPGPGRRRRGQGRERSRPSRTTGTAASSWRESSVEAACETANYRGAPYTETTLRPAPSMKFHGSENYVATPDLMLAVNAAPR
jgi:hypothetical protein